MEDEEAARRNSVLGAAADCSGWKQALCSYQTLRPQTLRQVLGPPACRLGRSLYCTPAPGVTSPTGRSHRPQLVDEATKEHSAHDLLEGPSGRLSRLLSNSLGELPTQEVGLLRPHIPILSESTLLFKTLQESF